MPLNHALLLLLVTVIWGVNFVAVKFGLHDVPPLTFSALRFFAAAFPAIFFVKRPDLPIIKLMLFGIFMFAGQFTFLFSAIHMGLSVGLASLVLQIQAFFTIGLAVVFLGEKPNLFQILGAIVAMMGIGVVALHVGGDVTMPSLMLSILAAASWGAGNIIIKTFGKTNMFGVVVWGSFFAFFPLSILAYVVEGPETVLHSLLDVSSLALWSLAYIVYLSTYVGYTLWNRMLAHYSAAIVAPFTLLVPAFGMLSATLVLGEPYPGWKFGATIFILSGLCLNQFGKKLQSFFKKKQLASF